MKNIKKLIIPIDKEEKTFMATEHAYKSLPKTRLNAMKKRLTDAAKQTNPSRTAR